MGKDICPICGYGSFLTWQKDHNRLGCDKCGFLDRRQGSSVIDQKHERRGAGAIGAAWDTLSKWEHNK